MSFSREGWLEGVVFGRRIMGVLLSFFLPFSFCFCWALGVRNGENDTTSIHLRETRMRTVSNGGQARRGLRRDDNATG